MMTFCLCYVLFLTLPSIIIDTLQIRHIKAFAKKQAVILQPKDYAISADYSLANLRLSIISHIFEAFVFIAWVSFALAKWQDFLAEEATLGFIIFVLGFVLINAFL